MAEIKYSKAMKDLEGILRKVEDEEIDVDELAANVKEAVRLIRVCREKIERAESQVQEVVKDFDAEEFADED